MNAEPLGPVPGWLMRRRKANWVDPEADWLMRQIEGQTIYFVILLD